MQSILDSVREAAAAFAPRGAVASYIPALLKADPLALGIAVTTAEGRTWSSGQADRRFTVQSVSKVLALAYVAAERGLDAVFARVGKEPTGDPFNSIIRLETGSGRKPFNPFINAGAIVVSGMMPGDTAEDRGEGFLRYLRGILGRDDVGIDREVYLSERATGARNRSIAWFLKELCLLDGEVEDTLDAYFMQCAVLMDAKDLSRVGAALALDGMDPTRGIEVMDRDAARVIKSLMVTCGLYDGSGEFAVDVGIPAKSGVGGGIVAAVRGRMGIGTYGPALDECGNSIAGLEALKELSARLGLRVL